MIWSLTSSACSTATVWSLSRSLSGAVVTGAVVTSPMVTSPMVTGAMVARCRHSHRSRCHGTTSCRFGIRFFANTRDIAFERARPLAEVTRASINAADIFLLSVRGLGRVQQLDQQQHGRFWVVEWRGWFERRRQLERLEQWLELGRKRCDFHAHPDCGRQRNSRNRPGRGSLCGRHRRDADGVTSDWL